MTQQLDTVNVMTPQMETVFPSLESENFKADNRETQVKGPGAPHQMHTCSVTASGRSPAFLPPIPATKHHGHLHPREHRHRSLKDRPGPEFVVKENITTDDPAFKGYEPTALQTMFKEPEFFTPPKVINLDDSDGSNELIDAFGEFQKLAEETKYIPPTPTPTPSSRPTSGTTDLFGKSTIGSTCTSSTDTPCASRAGRKPSSSSLAWITRPRSRC